MKGRIIALQRVLLDVFPQFIMAYALPLVHPEEGDNRLIELLHFLCKGFTERVPLLPVTALDYAHVLRCSIPEVYREAFFHGLLLDLFQDGGFLFR